MVGRTATRTHRVRATGGSLPAGSVSEVAVVGPECDPDVLLMLRARDGDDSAFQILFQKHCASLVTFAGRFVQDSARAEELVQDAFLQIYRARERYEARARFLTFAYRVVTNLCLNERRRIEYQGRIESLDATRPDGEEAERQIPDDRPTSEDIAIGRQTAITLEDAMARLAPNQKAALLLARVEDLSYDEIASCLGTTVSAVKSLIFRATARLRQDLSHLLESESRRIAA